MGAAIAIALVAGTSPLDGRYFLEGAPGQCVRPAGDIESAVVITPGRLDAYEQRCDWGPLQARARAVWTARGRCLAEGVETPGAFRFSLLGRALTLRRPDGSTTRLRRCGVTCQPSSRSADWAGDLSSQEFPMIRKAEGRLAGTGRDGDGRRSPPSGVLDPRRPIPSRPASRTRRAPTPRS